MQERKEGCICQLDAETGEPVVENYGECPVHKQSLTPADTAKSLVLEMGRTFDKDVQFNEQQRRWLQGYIKKNAIVCVDQILSVLDTFQTHAYAKVLIPFYNEVKKEIQVLP